MARESRIPLYSLLVSLSDAVDLVSPVHFGHHRRVAYLALKLGAELDLDAKHLTDLLLAGILHDVGALSLQERHAEPHGNTPNPQRHSETGYLLLREFEPLEGAAEIIRRHHLDWDDGRGAVYRGESVPPGCHILHLAERVAGLVDRNQNVFGQIKPILRFVEEGEEDIFMPEVVEAFLGLSHRENFWLDLTNPALGDNLLRVQELEFITLELGELLSLADLFRRIIDFRSPFTATHSSGVAASAAALARVASFSQRECEMMIVAGYLHDLGKLAVPREILDKPGDLTEMEFHQMRSHPYHSFRLLERIDGMEVISQWAALHHERLDGSGYPFHLPGAEICLGARIMALADVFTAITEDRPHRKRSSPKTALLFIQNMANNLTLDHGVIKLLRDNFDEIFGLRMSAQNAAEEEYRQFLQAAGSSEG